LPAFSSRRITDLRQTTSQVKKDKQIWKNLIKPEVQKTVSFKPIGKPVVLLQFMVLRKERNPMNIMIVEDLKMVSEVLSSILECEPDLKVVAIADNGKEAISKARYLKPDIIVMDLSMPEMNGLEACRRIIEEIPDSKIIVLSMHSEREFVVDALKAGAMGYIQKMSAFKTLVRAIRSVQANKGFLDPEITGIDFKDYFSLRNKSGTSEEKSPLSPREQEILRLLTEGKSSKEVSLALNISPKTVENHRRQIMKKLQLSNLADLTRYAIRQGISSL
jgi:DNA-binding NarL/FixJ family response regulator